MARDGGFRQLHLLLSAKRREPLTRDPGRCKIYGKSASVGRVWTAPLVQGVSEKNSDAVRFAVVCPARGRWPRWVPRSTPKRKRDLAGRHPTRVLWIVGPTDQHLFSRALQLEQTNVRQRPAA